MKALIKFCCIVLLTLFSSSGFSQNEQQFISPVKIPVFLSGNFGELRSDHFHSGIDIKTQGVIGKEIVAAADGYIYRITVSPGGFGKAIYLRHPNGYSTVYGHLDRFNADIEKYVKNRQYEQKSFSVNLYPQRNEFSFKQGELIAYSGNTGSSGGPHLHYEIRKSDNEDPINPLLFGIDIKDNIAPVLQTLFIYPLSNTTSIDGNNSVKQINLAGSRGNYNIPNTIVISGKAGFGIRAYDLVDGSNNRCGVYSIELVIDGATVYKFVIDEFAFAETRFLNSHIDYETYIRSRIHVQKAFVLPNDRLRLYSNLINRGIFDFNDDKTHNVTFYVTDVHDNKSTLSFNVKSVSKSDIVAKNDNPNVRLMPHNRQNRFVAENLRVTIPNNALYDTLRFQYSLTPRTGRMLSGVHQVASKFYPLHQACTISIKPEVIISGKESKMLIMSVDGNRRSALNSVWDNDYLTATTTTFGNFTVGIDTIPPTITPIGFTAENDFTGKKEMRIRITDDLSGIRTYEPEIDGKWALFEYDQKNNVLIYTFDETRITKGARHDLTMTVTDRKDNISVYKTTFRW